MTNDTYKGRINIGLSHLKKLFPDKQIVLLTPLHRSLAEFGERMYNRMKAIRINAENMWMLMYRALRKQVICGEFL